MANPVNVAIEVLPLHPDPYPIVDAAIKVIRESGVKHEVGPMETTMEGDLDELLAIVKAAHKACFVNGVSQVVTIVKIGESTSGTSIEGKVGKYR